MEATDSLPAITAQLFRLDAAIREASLGTAMNSRRKTGGSLHVTYPDCVAGV